MGGLEATQAIRKRESEMRFHWVIHQFISALTQPPNFLVLFLDDWQWADGASLSLINALMSNINNFLLIASYRDNEVSPTDPPMIAISDLRSLGVQISTIQFSPLDENAVTMWISETLHCSLSKAKPLGTVIHNKTKGLPFFIKIFLQTLYDQGIIGRSEDQWEWDIDKINKLPATENVITFMITQMQQMDRETQWILLNASLIGRKCTASQLQQLVTGNFQNTLELLVEKGMFMQHDDELWFAHDRIQEAAHQLLPQENRGSIHVSIGRLYRANLHEPTLEQWFSMVDHFNLGDEVEDMERWTLAKLNLEAAHKAKHAIAYKTALSYLHHAELDLAGIDYWEKDYGFATTFHKEMAELEYLSDNFERSNVHVDILLENLRTVPEKVNVYRICLQALSMRAHYAESVSFAFKALRLLGLEVDEVSIGSISGRELEKLEQNLSKKSIDELYDAPLMESSTKKSMLDMLYYLVPTAFIYNKPLLYLIAPLILNCTLEYGNSEQSAMGYIIYAMLKIAKMEFKTGGEYADLALRLADKFHDLTDESMVHFIYAINIHHWIRPIQQYHIYLKRVIEHSNQAADLQSLGYAMAFNSYYSFHTGVPLTKVVAEVECQLEQYCIQKNQVAFNTLTALHMAVLNLLGKSRSPKELHDHNKSAAEYVEQWRSQYDYYTLFKYYSIAIMTHYLNGNIKEAYECILDLEKIPRSTGNYELSIKNLYHSLTLISMYPSASPDDKTKFWETLRENQRQLKIWADNCPSNFMHMHELVAAEISRLNGDFWNAIESYEKSIQLAKEGGFIQAKALANELAGNFWLEQKKQSLSKGLFLATYLAFQTWGAKNKISMLIQRHGKLLESLLSMQLSSFAINGEGNINPGDLRMLDLTSLLQSSQAISSEVDLKKLLEKIIRVLIENVGAQKSAFLVEEFGTLYVRAEATIDKEIKLQKLPLSQWESGSQSIIQYTKRSQRSVLLGSTNRLQFSYDPYFTEHQNVSILCVPIISHKQFKGVIYVENNFAPHMFTEKHVQILTILASQVAISFENATFYESIHSVTERLNLAMEAANMGIYDWDMVAPKLAWDFNTCEIYGASTNELLDKFPTPFMHPEDRPEVEKNLHRVFTNKEENTFSAEYRILKGLSKSNVRTLSARGRIFRDEKKNAVRMLGVVWDITERKLLEQERLQALKLAEEKERRRAEDAEINRKNLQDFVNMICHEIRNPMAGIYGNIDFLDQSISALKSMTDKHPDLDHLIGNLDESTQEIMHCVKHQKAIVDNVLDLSVLETGNNLLVAQPFSLKNLIEQTTKIFPSVMKKKNLHLLLEFPQSDIWVKSDPHRLKLALVNLITNAIKFTEVGYVKITLDIHETNSSHVTFAIVVEDTGKGMSPEELNQLFQRFGRGCGAEYEGSGLGLFISKRTIECLGVQMNVTSKKGAGSIFSIVLKVEITRPPEEILMPEQIVQPTPLSPSFPAVKKILVVEDNLVNQRILQKQIEPAGYRCELACNGLEALEKAKKTPFDLILMDVEMPVMGGLEATQAIRKRESEMNISKKIPIIAISAYATKKSPRWHLQLE